MESRSRNIPIKRVFGKDITNNDQRRPKVNSISEKPSSIIEPRLKSRSFDKRIAIEHKDPIAEYEQEIVAFMLSIQVSLLLFRKKKRRN
jgi:hypothetical protein